VIDAKEIQATVQELFDSPSGCSEVSPEERVNEIR
jgi:hypothetical protein